MWNEHRFAGIDAVFCGFCAHGSRRCAAAGRSRVAGLFGPCRPGTRSKRGECRRSGGKTGSIQGACTERRSLSAKQAAKPKFDSISTHRNLDGPGFAPPPQPCNAGSYGDKVAATSPMPCLSAASLRRHLEILLFRQLRGVAAMARAVPAIARAEFQ